PAGRDGVIRSAAGPSTTSTSRPASSTAASQPSSPTAPTASAHGGLEKQKRTAQLVLLFLEAEAELRRGAPEADVVRGGGGAAGELVALDRVGPPGHSAL